jgi:hypothetical protein
MKSNCILCIIVSIPLIVCNKLLKVANTEGTDVV